jgi:hypothetical protein
MIARSLERLPGVPTIADGIACRQNYTWRSAGDEWKSAKRRERSMLAAALAGWY